MPRSKVGDSKGRIDLSLLPGIRHTDLDGGPYFTPVVVSKDAAGRYNVSWNRMQYLDRNTWRYTCRRGTSGLTSRQPRRRPSRFPSAVVLGHHPAFHLTGAMLSPLHVDEYEATGGVLGEGLEVTPSETWGDRFLVPAQSEIVIEGAFSSQAVCGRAVGRIYGLRPAQRLSWVVEIDSVAMREAPILIDIFPCQTEHMNAHLPIEASIYQRAKEAVPGVVKTCWVGSGGPLD